MNQKYIYGHKETKAAYILDRNNNKKINCIIIYSIYFIR